MNERKDGGLMLTILQEITTQDMLFRSLFMALHCKIHFLPFLLNLILHPPHSAPYNQHFASIGSSPVCLQKVNHPFHIAGLLLAPLFYRVSKHCDRSGIIKGNLSMRMRMRVRVRVGVSLNILWLLLFNLLQSIHHQRFVGLCYSGEKFNILAGQKSEIFSPAAQMRILVSDGSWQSGN